MVAYGLSASVHQKTVSISGRKTKVNQQNANDIITVIKIPIATHLDASSFFFSQSLMLRKLAVQSQNNKANQRQTIVSGKTIFVAQFARNQIHLPIKT